MSFISKTITWSKSAPRMDAETVFAFRRRIAGMDSLNRILAMAAYHAAPTLAGFKPAALFKPGDGCGELPEALSRSVATHFRLDVAEFATRRGDALLLVHSPELMSRALATAGARELFAESGYACAAGEIGILLDGVRNRCLLAAFPHEIGVFLGYPVEDVRRFMRKGRGGCSCCGAGCGWQVYGDGAAALAHSRRCRNAKLRAARLVLDGVEWERFAAALRENEPLRAVV
jgi:hypothetical protein